jgi:hypothetical protein
VDLNVTGRNNNRTSWTDACPDLQTALLTTTSGQIRVAQGTCYPGPAGNPAATFALKYNVSPPPLPGEDPIWIRVTQVVRNYDLFNCCVEGLFRPGTPSPLVLTNTVSATIYANP